MISLVEEKEELDFLPSDPYAARITALIETYGTEHSFAMFWVQRVDEVPVAAISRVDGNMTLCCGENTDFEELSCFINAVGFTSVTFDAEFSERLGITPQKTSYTVKYKGNAERHDSEMFFDYDKKEIYYLLCECGFELGDYGSFLSDVCARLNKSTASFAAVEAEGKLCACAFALFEGQKSVLLGAVATNPAARGRGFASKLVGTLAEMKKDKDVYLFCRNDGLAGFYAKIGFEIIGKWAIYSL